MWTDAFNQVLSNMNEAYMLLNITCSKFKSDYSFITKKVNSPFEKITGLESEKIIGNNLCHVLGVDERSFYDRLLESYTESKAVVTEAYSPVVHKKLRFKFFPSSLAHVGCIVSIIEKENYSLSAKDDALDCPSFLSVLNHEIRTPLNGVMGMLQLLGETSLNDEQRVIVDLGNRSAYRLLNFIEMLGDVQCVDPDVMVDSYGFKINENLHPLELLLKSGVSPLNAVS